MRSIKFGSRDYLKRAKTQLISGRAESLLYAALELRCGIEARLQECLSPHAHIPLGRRTDWRIGNLRKSTEHAFRLGDRIARIQIADPTTLEIFDTVFYTPVTRRLTDIGVRLGGYLHVPGNVGARGRHIRDLRKLVTEGVALLEVATFGTLLGPLVRSANGKPSSLGIELPRGTAKKAAIYRNLVGRQVTVIVKYFDRLEDARYGIIPRD